MGKQNPKISVCMPVWNTVDHIEETVEGWIAQAFEDIEICISDNASDDGTWEILRRLAKQDIRIRLNRNSENLGAAKNFRITHDMATGDYMVWAGSDDLYDPAYCGKLLRELESNPSCQLAVCALRRVSRRDDTLIEEVRYHDNYDPNRLSALATMLHCLPRTREAGLASNYCYFCLGLYRRAFVSVLLKNDPDFIWRFEYKLPALAAMCGGIRYVDEVLVTKRIWQQRDKVVMGDPTKPRQVHKARVKWWVETMQCFIRAPVLPWYWKLVVPVIYMPVAVNAAKVMVVQYAYLYASKGRKQLQAYLR